MFNIFKKKRHNILLVLLLVTIILYLTVVFLEEFYYSSDSHDSQGFFRIPKVFTTSKKQLKKKQLKTSEEFVAWTLKIKTFLYH